MPRVHVTFYAAQMVPPEFFGRRSDYIDAVSSWCADAAAVGADSVDVNCEDGRFTAEEARWILNAGRRVAILIGAGARGAAEEVVRVTETLGAGVAKALLGKDVLPDDLPFVTGSIGLLGTKPSSDMMDGCDTLLMIGTGFPWAEFLPADGQARAVQIDIAPEMLGLRYPVEVNLHGDAGETLRALLPLLDRQGDRGWQDGIAAAMDDWRETLKGRAMAAASPVNPQRVVYEMSPRLPADAIVTSDSGSCAK